MCAVWRADFAHEASSWLSRYISHKCAMIWAEIAQNLGFSALFSKKCEFFAKKCQFLCSPYVPLFCHIFGFYNRNSIEKPEKVQKNVNFCAHLFSNQTGLYVPYFGRFQLKMYCEHEKKCNFLHKYFLK